MREVDIFKNLWQELNKNLENGMEFNKAKDIYIKKYQELDIYKVEKSRINAPIDAELEKLNKELREIGAKEIDFKMNVENVEKLAQESQRQTVARMNDTKDLEELKSIHKRGTLISAGERVQELSSYVNLLLNQEIRKMAIDNTVDFAKETKSQVMVVNNVTLGSEICANYIGNIYDADDDGELPTYHPNCNCTVRVILEEEDKKNATLISGKEAQEFEKYRTNVTRLNRELRQQQRLGEDTSTIRERLKENKDNADEIVKGLNITDRQKANLGFNL